MATKTYDDFTRKGNAGASGCAYKTKPPICTLSDTTEIDTESVIQKAISNDIPKGESASKAQKEHLENVEIEKIDPNNDFTVKYHGMCSVDDRDYETRILQNSCPPRSP